MGNFYKQAKQLEDICALHTHVTGPDNVVPFEKAIPNITDVGSDDIINWKRIFAASEQAGIRHYFVEHDQPASPLESLQRSGRYLAALHF
jgi:hypothetical protein